MVPVLRSRPPQLGIVVCTSQHRGCFNPNGQRESTFQVRLYKSFRHAFKDVQGFGRGIPPGPATRQSGYFSHKLVVHILARLMDDERELVTIHC